LLALLCLLGAVQAEGQVLSAGLSGAPVLQVGSFGDGRTLGTGWHVGAGARLDMRTRPFGFQFDAGVASSPYADAGREGHVQSWDAGLSGVWRPVGVTHPVRPYLMAGLGVYYVEEPERNLITPALSAGAGVEGGTRAIRAFVEARYHYVFTWGGDLQYVPISVGVRYAFNP
jgi:hypothetical protein